MRKVFLLCVLLMSTSAIVLCGQTPDREFRGNWLATVMCIDWPKTQVTNPNSQSQIAAQKQELIDLFDGMVAANMNAVLFQIRPMADALYPSSFIPYSAYLTGERGRGPGYDPLAFAIEEAHKRGLELHGWMNPYRYENSSTTHSSNDYILRDHPSWVIRVGQESILNPGLAAVRTHIAQVTAEVVRNYPEIDGIVWDDYFYLSSISNQDSESFANNNAQGLSLSDWRRDNVNKTVQEVYDTIKGIDASMRFGISPRGIWSVSSAAAQKYGVTLPQGITGSDNYNTIYCDALAWMSSGSIDYISPQLYWPSYQSGQDYRVLSPWWQSMADRYDVDYYASQALYRGYPMSEIGLQIGVNRTADMNSPGSIFYNTTYFMKDSVTPYLLSRYFQRPILTPEISDKGLGELAQLTELYYNLDSTEISWKSDKEVGSYAVYLVPNNPRGNPFDDFTYLIGRVWEEKFDVTDYKSRLADEWFAVAPINRYIQLGNAQGVVGAPVNVVIPYAEEPLYYSTSTGLRIEMGKASNVRIYGVNGYLWYSERGVSLVELTVPRGVYILQINGRCYKLVR